MQLLSPDNSGIIAGVLSLFIAIILLNVAVVMVFIVWRKKKVVILSNVTHNISIHHWPSSSSVVLKFFHQVQGFPVSPFTLSLQDLMLREDLMSRATSLAVLVVHIVILHF